MSSEIIRSDSIRAESFPWRQVRGESHPVYPSSEPERPQRQNEGNGISEEQLRRELDQARQQGFRDGQTDALQAAGARVDAVLQKLTRAIEEAAGQRARFRREAEEDVVKLALAIARRIVCRELTIDPDIILALVKAGIQKLDARDIYRVRANPDDAARIKNYFDSAKLPSRIEVQADSSLEQGAVVFTTARGTLDVSVNTQLGEIERGFSDLMRRQA
jgi:flagellar assembly protein FliH